MNILIVKLSAIGDVIHTLPALAALRKSYPAADITWAVEEAAADLLAGHPALNRIIVSRRKRWLKEIKQGHIAAPLREIRAFLRELRQRPYDLVIDFHGLLKSAVIVAASGGRRRLGYDSLQELSGFFYNEKIPEAMGKHAVDRYLDFVRYLDGERADRDAAPPPAVVPEFTVAIGAAEQRRVADLLAPHAETHNPFVAVNPVAFWETKLWEDEKFAALCDRIREELGIGVVLTGGKVGPLDRILARMKTKAVNLGGQTTLRELACLYGQAALLITTDSGPMHLAAAVGTPVVALFGPTDPTRTGPYGTGHRVIRGRLSCIPCLRKQCETRDCMRGITVDEVFEAVKELLEKRGLIEQGGDGAEKRPPTGRKPLNSFECSPNRSSKVWEGENDGNQ